MDNFWHAVSTGIDSEEFAFDTQVCRSALVFKYAFLRSLMCLDLHLLVCVMHLIALTILIQNASEYLAAICAKRFVLMCASRDFPALKASPTQPVTKPLCELNIYAN